MDYAKIIRLRSRWMAAAQWIWRMEFVIEQIRFHWSAGFRQKKLTLTRLLLVRLEEAVGATKQTNSSDEALDQKFS